MTTSFFGIELAHPIIKASRTFDASPGAALRIAAELGQMPSSSVGRAT